MVYLRSMYSRNTEHTAEPRQATPALRSAAHDYRWLLDHGYPDAPSLRLVGDRYRLSGTERGILYRGVFSEPDSGRRAARLTIPERGSPDTPTELTIDGHNVLLTVWNCLSGRPIVLATDGFVRDIGGTRARLPHDDRFTRVTALLLQALESTGYSPVTVLLDEQLPWSRDHCAEINALHATAGMSGHNTLTATTNTSVDATVAAATDGTIATSDTGIIDRSTRPVLDLGGYIVLHFLKAQPLHLSHLCERG